MELNQYLSLGRAAWRGYLKIKEILCLYSRCWIIREKDVGADCHLVFGKIPQWSVWRGKRRDSDKKEQILTQAGTSRDAV